MPGEEVPGRPGCPGLRRAFRGGSGRALDDGAAPRSALASRLCGSAAPRRGRGVPLGSADGLPLGRLLALALGGVVALALRCGLLTLALRGLVAVALRCGLVALALRGVVAPALRCGLLTLALRGLVAVALRCGLVALALRGGLLALALRGVLTRPLRGLVTRALGRRLLALSLCRLLRLLAPLGVLSRLALPGAPFRSRSSAGAAAGLAPLPLTRGATARSRAVAGCCAERQDSSREGFCFWGAGASIRPMRSLARTTSTAARAISVTSA